MITTKPVLCRACGTQFSAHELTKEDCNVLHDQHYYQEFTEELRMLRKVEDYFLRYPHALERFQSTSRLFSPEGDFMFHQRAGMILPSILKTLLPGTSRVGMAMTTMAHFT